MCAHRDTCGRESRNPVVSFTWFIIPEKVGQESSRGKNTEKWQELFMHVIPIAGGWLYCMLSPKIALFFHRYMFFVICHLYRHFGLYICPHSYEIITRCLLAECGEVLHKYLVNSWLRACNFLPALWEKQGKYFTHEENWAKTLSLNWLVLVTQLPVDRAGQTEASVTHQGCISRQLTPKDFWGIAWSHSTE